MYFILKLCFNRETTSKSTKTEQLCPKRCPIYSLDHLEIWVWIRRSLAKLMATFSADRDDTCVLVVCFLWRSSGLSLLLFSVRCCYSARSLIVFPTNAVELTPLESSLLSKSPVTSIILNSWVMPTFYKLPWKQIWCVGYQYSFLYHLCLQSTWFMDQRHQADW